MKKNIESLLIISAIAVIVAGCRSPSSHFYTLNATATSHGTNDLQYAVFVGPVTIPAEVDRPQFTLQISSNQVAIDEFNRWAEPLDKAIAHAVAGDLSALLGTSRVTSSPMANLNPAYRVSLNVQQFTSTPGKSAQIKVLWTIRKTSDQTIFSGQSDAVEPVQGNDFNELAIAHSHALAKISADIAAVIRAEAKAPMQNSEQLK